MTLLGHLVRKQLPWVHHISRSPLLGTLLRCLKVTHTLGAHTLRTHRTGVRLNCVCVCTCVRVLAFLPQTDADVVVLVSALLVLITLLPMMPQAGKQHIYDFFDVFGRLTSWSFRNPGNTQTC